MFRKIFISFLALVFIFIPLNSYSESGKSIVLKINSKTAFVNFQPVTLDVAPIEIKGRTLVPLRFISEHFGAKKITYIAETQEIALELDDPTSLRNEITYLKTENESLKNKIRDLENGKTPNPPPPPPPNPTEDDWEFQFSFQDRKYPHNLNNVYIKQDSNNYLFKFTSYRTWNESNNFVLFLYINKDLDKKTGARLTKSKTQSGEDFLVKVTQENEVLIGNVAIYNKDTDYFDIGEKITQCNIEPNILTFSVPKKFFVAGSAFFYWIGISYKNGRFNDEYYPSQDSLSILTYPNPK